VPLTRSRRLTGGAVTLAAGVVVASAAVASLPATTAIAAPAPRPVAASVSPAAAAASYLVRRLQGPHRNHYSSSYRSGGRTVTYVNYGETADAALSMDAAGVAQTAAKRVTRYLERHVGSYVLGHYSPGQAGKLALLAEAQHVGPRHFGGTNLLNAIRSSEGRGDAKRGEYQQNPAGTPTDFEFFSTASQALAMLALAEAPHTPGQPNHAAQVFLRHQQCANGGFPTQLLSDPTTACRAGSDVDSTGYAVQALLASGEKKAAGRGLDFLRKAQHGNGGFGAQGSDANSTAIAVEALVAGHRHLHGAVAWLRRHQVGCSGKAARRGAVNFQQGYDASASLLASSQAGVALAAKSLASVSRKGASPGVARFGCPAR
jgi:hypothetical protein